MENKSAALVFWGRPRDRPLEEKNMSITALGAGAEKAQEIIFISEAHEKFYYENPFKSNAYSWSIVGRVGR